MRLRSLLPCAVALLAFRSLAAQNLSGTYVLTGAHSDSLVVTFGRDSAGVTRGTVVSRDQEIALTGRRRAGGLAGPTTSAKGPGYFSAALRGAELDLVLADVNARGAPDFDTARQFVLTRRAPADSAGPPRKASRRP